MFFLFPIFIVTSSVASPMADFSTGPRISCMLGCCLRPEFMMSQMWFRNHMISVILLSHCFDFCMFIRRFYTEFLARSALIPFTLPAFSLLSVRLLALLLGSGHCIHLLSVAPWSILMCACACVRHCRLGMVCFDFRFGFAWRSGFPQLSLLN